jgi:hypothetical protein
MDENEIDRTGRAIDLMINWEQRAMLARQAHYDSANYYNNLHYWFGIPVIALTTLVGTGVFATLQESVDNNLRVITGVFGVISAILASLQTFFNYQGLSEKHRSSGNKYSALAREMEMRLKFLLAYDDMVKFVDDWRMRYDAIQDESPSVPQKIWLSALKKHDESLGLSTANQPSAAKN